jgi:hypothetical protein
MTYASPAWEFAADTHCKTKYSAPLAIIQGAHRFAICTFQIPFVYDYITKLSRQQAEVIQNHANENVRNMDKAKPVTENTRGLNLAAVKHMTVQVTRLPL